MVQHTDRECVIELATHGRLIQVRLHDMHVLEMSRIRERGLYGYAEVERDHIASTEFGGQRGMAPLAAATFEHGLATKEFGVDRAQPIEELLAIAIGQLGIARPFVAEC